MYEAIYINRGLTKITWLRMIVGVFGLNVDLIYWVIVVVIRMEIEVVVDLLKRMYKLY